MADITNQDIAQFAPSASRGDATLNTNVGQAIAVLISPNQATAMKAGDGFKFDSAQTVPGLPWVVKAGDADKINGVILATKKANSFVAGDIAEGLCALGPVVVLVAAATVVPGAILETAANGVQTKNAGASKYLCLDYGTVGMTVRCAILPILYA